MKSEHCVMGKRWLLFVVVLLVASTACAQMHEEWRVGSAAAGGGALVLVRQGTGEVVVQRTLCSGGACLWSANHIGFLAVQEAQAGAFPLRAGVQMRLEMVAGDPAVSVRVGSTLLRSAGDSVLLGSAPDLHVHPSWQLTLPEGQTGAREITLRLLPQAGTGSGYSASAPFTARLVTVSEAEPSPTATASPSATATATAEPTATATASPSASPTAQPTGTATASPSATATATAEPTATATASPSASPTAQPTGTATASPSATATATAEPTPTATASPTAEAEATPTPGEVSVPGDCNGDGAVTVDEVIQAVRIALGLAEVGACSAADLNADGAVTIDEIVSAVLAALRSA